MFIYVFLVYSEPGEMTSYTSFKGIANHEVEDRDYRIKIECRDSHVLIMAPHGGKIEPNTMEGVEVIVNTV
jgi:phage replication-related protein YjqB (UPF0714/DUF867 family)